MTLHKIREALEFYASGIGFTEQCDNGEVAAQALEDLDTLIASVPEGLEYILEHEWKHITEKQLVTILENIDLSHVKKTIKAAQILSNAARGET